MSWFRKSFSQLLKSCEIRNSVCTHRKWLFFSRVPLANTGLPVLVWAYSQPRQQIQKVFHINIPLYLKGGHRPGVIRVPW